MRKLILLVLSLFLLLVLFQLPTYSYWLENNLLSYDAVKEQSEHMSLDDRKLSRYGGMYGMYLQIATVLKKDGKKDPIILIPPDECVQKIAEVKDFHMDEPLVFYYFTGIRAVSASSSDARKATWALTPYKGAPLIVTKISSPQHLEAILADFKKYKLNY